MALFEKLDINPDRVPTYKLGIHIAQAALLLVIFILEIVLFRAPEASINGNNGWPFGLCFLSIPAILYLAMTPRFERTQRAAQPHVMLIVDVVFTVLWLSAFATQASYNTANSCGTACSTSKAIVGLAFFEIVAWAGTTVFSIISLRYYQYNGNLPGYDKIKRSQNIDPDKAAFSTAPHDEEAYAPVHMDDHHDRHDDDRLGRHDDDNAGAYDPDAYGARPMYEAETSYRPQNTASPAPHENPFDNSYQSHSSTPHNDPYADPYVAPSQGPRIYAPPAAEDYDDHRPAQFPTGNYDRTL